jgi:hypothetical protein
VHLFSRGQTRGESDYRAEEEAKARKGRGIAGYCSADGADDAAVRSAVAEMIRASGPAQGALRSERLRKTFSPSECPSPQTQSTAKVPPSEPSPAPARTEAPKAPQAAGEKESLRGPRLLIQGAVDLARRLAKRTRDQVNDIRYDKQRRRDELLAKKKAEEEDRRLRAQSRQDEQQYPWDPSQGAWSAAASGGQGGASAGGASGYGSGGGGGGGTTGAFRPAGGGRLSAFPQGGVRPQFSQQSQQQGGP